MTADRPRCATCRHWARGRAGYSVKCWSTWGGTESAACRRPGRPGALAIAASDDAAELTTDATFGCVQHEPLDVAFQVAEMS